MGLTYIPPGHKILAFIDTETTGLDTLVHEVIEFAILREWPGGRIEEWTTKIKPERLEDADPEAFKFNRYGEHPEEWVGAPPMHVVAPAILDMLEGCVIVGHNVEYDVNILYRNLARTSIPIRHFPHHKLDTVTLVYEHLVPCGLERLSLGDACKFTGIKVEGRHTALGDVRATRELFHALTQASYLDRLRWRLRAFRGQFR